MISLRYKKANNCLLAYWTALLALLLHNSSWKIKLEKFKTDHKYFAKQTKKSWKPQKIIIAVGELFN